MADVQRVEEAVYNEMHFLEAVLPTCPKTLRPQIETMLAERQKMVAGIQERMVALRLPLTDQEWRYIEQDSKEV